MNEAEIDNLHCMILKGDVGSVGSCNGWIGRNGYMA